MPPLQAAAPRTTDGGFGVGQIRLYQYVDDHLIRGQPRERAESRGAVSSNKHQLQQARENHMEWLIIVGIVLFAISRLAAEVARKRSRPVRAISLVRSVHDPGFDIALSAWRGKVVTSFFPGRWVPRPATKAFAILHPRSVWKGSPEASGLKPGLAIRGMLASLSSPTVRASAREVACATVSPS